ncbi:ATP-dependent DNA helicase RecG [Mollicutes bacterium LVI A0078]|nr:ATP-dependent DNA helicase RecG [Mollicutes bacterium LVI A0075]WOO90984.1 ATP-dependent DNA helicase RecG [Mollicutes bacterium LVI A0078]
MFNQTANITTLKGVGEKTAAPFFDKNIQTIDDLITYLPLSYIAYSSNDMVDGSNVILNGVINSPVHDFSPRRNLLITNFTITDGETTHKIVAWNMRHLKFAFKSGDSVSILGKYDQARNQITLKKIEEITDQVHGDNIVAAYSKINKVSNLKINKFILNAIEASELSEDQKQMLIELHKPTSFESLHNAREQFKRHEFTAYYKKILAMSFDQKEDIGFAQQIDMNVINDFKQSLPYSLTSAQESAVISGLEALQAPKPMQSLMLGDVGSGKTIVSLIYALAVLNNGGQVAFMLPTEILAKQVFSIIQQLLPNYQSDLLVSSVKPSHKKLLKARLQTGSLDIVVGTHALIEDDVEFSNLRLVIIDEQHRFGVNQRDTLVNKGQFVNYCYLSATPIPRTLAHTLYGVIDIINIDSKPANRIPIETTVYAKSQKKAMMSVIDSELAKGNQVFIITPLAYEVEDLPLNDSLSTYESFEKYYKDKYNVGMINGQLKADHKDKIMNMFRNKEYDLLVATTVIEVGVDIPGATTIAILNAERFGLATLHQLRGRVGRNDLQSYCLLLDESNNAESKERLKLMETIDNGAELATLDYQMRGMGEVTGIRQSGNEDFKLFDLQQDNHLAEEIINELNKE